MGNLSLHHPLALLPLSDQNLVWGTSLPLLWQWLMVGSLWLRHILKAAQSHSYLPSIVRWLHSKTSCPPLHYGCHLLDVQGPLVCLVCCHPPGTSLQDLHFLLVSTLFHCQICKMGTSSNISDNTYCTCRVLWTMVSVLLFWIIMLHCWCTLQCCSLLLRTILGQNASLLATCND